MGYMDCSDWSNCTFCGECLVKCPVMQMHEPEARREIERLVRGEGPTRVMSECTLCFKCNNYCPEGLRPYELILQRVTERSEVDPARDCIWIEIEKRGDLEALRRLEELHASGLPERPLLSERKPSPAFLRRTAGWAVSSARGWSRLSRLVR